MDNEPKGRFRFYGPPLGSCPRAPLTRMRKCSKTATKCNKDAVEWRPDVHINIQRIAKQQQRSRLRTSDYFRTRPVRLSNPGI